jgi:tetratricopeptide (TPR) repeat protein
MIVVMLAWAMLGWAVEKHAVAKTAEEHFQSFVLRMAEARYPEAQAEIENAVRLSPKNAYYVAGKGLLDERMMGAKLRSDVYLAGTADLDEDDKRHVEGAMRAYERALALNPNDGCFHHNLGWLYALSGYREQAIDCFKKAIEADGASALYRVSFGLFYEQGGLTEDAANEYSLAIRLSPSLLDSRFFSDFKGRRPSKAEELVAGVAQYLKNQVRQTGDPFFKARLAKVYVYSGRPEALETLRQTTRELPNLSRPWLYLGKLYELQSNDGEAKRCYDRAVFLDKSDYASQLQLGKSYDREQRTSDAIGCYRSAIEQWLYKPSVSARRVARIYLAAHIVPNDLVPEGLLSYTEPDFDLAGTCSRLAALYRDTGKTELASYYERLGKEAVAGSGFGVPGRLLNAKKPEPRTGDEQ